MKRAHRTVVAGVHRLQHVERLSAAYLADDDAVRPHAQRVAHEVADGDLAMALDVGGFGLEADHMHLPQAELGGILAGHDALIRRNETREDVEQRRLAGTGPTRDDDVETRLDRRVEVLKDGLARAAGGDDALRRQNLASEFADRQAWPVNRDGRNHDVHARPVLQPRIAHRLRLVDATTNSRHDAVDDTAQTRLVLERKAGQLDPASPLDEDLLWPVDHDLGDVRVAQRRLERPEADDLVEQDLHQALAIRRRAERGGRLGAKVLFRELHQESPDPSTVADVDRRGVTPQHVSVDLGLCRRQGRTQDCR